MCGRKSVCQLVDSLPSGLSRVIPAVAWEKRPFNPFFSTDGKTIYFRLGRHEAEGGLLRYDPRHTQRCESHKFRTREPCRLALLIGRNNRNRAEYVADLDLHAS